MARKSASKRLQRRRCVSAPPQQLASLQHSSAAGLAAEPQQPPHPDNANPPSPLHPPSSRRQQFTYQVSAIAATTGVSALAILATYYKFSYMTGPDSPFPWLDMAGTLALVVGGVAGMEMWARWAHKVLWHDFQPGWALHKSHHAPRVGPFEVGARQTAAAASGPYGPFTAAVGSRCGSWCPASHA